VWVHGGGWIGGEKWQLLPFVEHEVDRGAFAVVSVQYRMAPAHPFPAGLEDVKRAVRFVKAYASRYDLRSDEVVIAGHSAGGNLAAILGATAGVFEPGGLPVPLARQDSKVAGVIDVDGPANLADFWRTSAWGVPLTQQYLQCPTPAAGCPGDRMRIATVATWLDPSDPPAFIVNGGADPIVSAQYDAETLYSAWRAVRGDAGVVLDVSPGEQHVPAHINVAALDRWLADVLAGRYAPSPSARPRPLAPPIRLVHADGRMSAWRTPVLAPTTRLPLPAVAAALTPDGRGGWETDWHGDVAPLGRAVRSYGSLVGRALAHPIMGIATTPSGHGYWLVAADGGIFAFGDARYFGSLAGLHLAHPIVSIVATSTGRGYYLLGLDGGVFAFGDARFRGNAASRLRGNAVAIATSGNGYLVASTAGQVAAFGGAAGFGGANPAGHGHVVAIVPATAGPGYRLVTSDGTILHVGTTDRTRLYAWAPSTVPVVAAG
jgi:acetyl esterase/lipase